MKALNDCVAALSSDSDNVDCASFSYIECDFNTVQSAGYNLIKEKVKDVDLISIPCFTFCYYEINRCKENILLVQKKFLSDYRFGNFYCETLKNMALQDKTSPSLSLLIQKAVGDIS